LLDRRPEELELDLLEKAEVSVLARGSLAQGLLINKPPKDYLGYTREEVSKLADKVAELSVSRSPAHTALRYVLQQPAVTAAVIGIRTQAQLEDITGVFQTPALSATERDALRQLLAPNTYTEHRV
jgi:aryl-alcohol dehydrogenase-like predicted oxidoreductase